MSQSENLESVRRTLSDAAWELMEIQSLAWAAGQLLVDCNDATLTKEEVMERAASLCRIVDQRSEALRDTLDREETGVPKEDCLDPAPAGATEG